MTHEHPTRAALLTKLRSHFLRIDARSLGLFRIGLGLTLVCDLFARWRWLVAFYSNDGVLPNHNHLFQVREQGRIWSVYHSFSSVDEATTAFVLTLLAFSCFLIGWHTRVFAVVSTVLFVALEGRNSLFGDVGSSLTIALLLPSLFLPLGSRFSVDSLRASFAVRDERTPDELNDRRALSVHMPRPSLAALTILLTLGLVVLWAGLMQHGATWKSGDALYYAMHTDSVASRLGLRLREHAAVLRPWTHGFRLAELAVLPLALVPFFRRYTRGLAMLCLGFVGLTLTLCFDLGTLGPTLLASVALLAPSELWDRARHGTRPLRLIYDDSCGICLWLARLLARLDLRRNVTFIPSSSEELPTGVERETVERSMVALDVNGRAHTDAQAVAQVLFALPLGAPLGLLVSLPGVRSLVARGYYRVASNRVKLSVACGLGSCGLTGPASATGETKQRDASRATRLGTSVVVALESGAIAFLFLAFLAHSERTGSTVVPLRLGSKAALASAASWARLDAPWGFFAPEPPLHNAALVIEAETREGSVYDVLTGKSPDLDLTDPAQHRLGTQWATFTAHVQRDEHSSYRQELRRYLMRGGVPGDSGKPPVSISKLKAWWVKAPIPAPGAAREGEVERTDILDASSLRPSPAADESARGLPRLKPDLRQLR